MRPFYFFKVDPVKQPNQRITNYGNDSCNEDADEDLRKIPGQETNHANDKDDEKKLVFLVQSAHASMVTNKYRRGSFRISFQVFIPIIQRY